MNSTTTTDIVHCRPFSWRGAFILVVMLSLVFSLATRTFHHTNSHGNAVRSNTAQAMRQHMVRDAARWVPPVFVYTAQRAPVFYPRVSPAGPPIPTLLLVDESLFNRPPPSC